MQNQRQAPREQRVRRAHDSCDMSTTDVDAVSTPRPLPITVAPRADAAWPSPQIDRSLRSTHVLVWAVLAIGCGYLLWRVLATLSPASLLLGVPLLILEAYSLFTFGLKALLLWDVDAVRAPVAVTETDASVAVLIPTFDEAHQMLMPTLTAATRMRLATQIIVLDDGHRAWLAGMCDELGIEYRARVRRVGGRAGQLNSALTSLTSDFVVVLGPDQVADRDYIGRTLPHFDDPHVALVQTPRDSYTQDSFEHVAHGRDRFAERNLFERVLAAGANRWNAGTWSGGGAIIRRSALADVSGIADGAADSPGVTTIRLHRAGWRTVHHNEALVRGRAANDAREYAEGRRAECAGDMQTLRRERPWTGRGLRITQRLGHLAGLSGWLDGWATLGYLVLPPLALLFALTPATGPVAAFAVLFTLLFTARQLATQVLSRGHAPRSQASVFAVLRMSATLGATLVLVTGRSPRPRPASTRPTRVPVLLWALLAVNAVALVWSVLTAFGLTPISYPYPVIAVGAVLWTAANLVVLYRAIDRIASTEFGRDRRQAHRIEVEGHVFLDGQRVHVLDLSLTGVRLLSYGDVPPIEAYVTMTFTDPNKRPAVVTGTVVGIDQRPHGREVRIDLESDQTYVLGAILAEALVR